MRLDQPENFSIGLAVSINSCSFFAVHRLAQKNIKQKHAVCKKRLLGRIAVWLSYQPGHCPRYVAQLASLPSRFGQRDKNIAIHPVPPDILLRRSYSSTLLLSSSKFFLNVVSASSSLSAAAPPAPAPAASLPLPLASPASSSARSRLQHHYHHNNVFQHYTAQQHSRTTSMHTLAASVTPPMASLQTAPPMASSLSI